jgi:hypothetical protein
MMIFYTERVRLVTLVSLLCIAQEICVAQKTINICTTHTELTLSTDKLKTQQDTSYCFDYEYECLRIRDSLHFFHNQTQEFYCSFWNSTLQIEYDTQGALQTIILNGEKSMDSLCRTNENEFMRYIRSTENKFIFDGKYIFTDTTIEVYSPIHISWWGEAEGTDNFFDNQNHLLERFTFSNGYLVKSLFREVFRGKETNKSETEYTYTINENSTKIVVHETSSSLGTQNKEIIVQVEGEYRISKFNLLSLLHLGSYFDVMYSSIFPLVLLHHPQLLESKQYE